MFAGIKHLFAKRGSLKKAEQPVESRTPIASPEIFGRQNNGKEMRSPAEVPQQAIAEPDLITLQRYPKMPTVPMPIRQRKINLSIKVTLGHVSERDGSQDSS